MCRSTLVAVQLVMALLAGQSASGQASALRPGTRIRLTVPEVSRTPFVGVVDTVGSETLVVRTSPEARSTIRLATVSRLEVSRGRKRPAWSLYAPLWMTAAGAGLGATAGYVASDDHGFFGRDFAAAAFGALGGVVGLVTGTSVAIAIKRDLWEAIDVGAPGSRSGRSPASLYVAPRTGGLGMGVRATF